VCPVFKSLLIVNNISDGAELGEEERGAGDGQESLGAKHDKVDVDEDRRNPAYIPKRGNSFLQWETSS
jgi:hypothetical protein